MKLVDLVQEKKIRLLFGLVAVIGVVSSVAIYLQKRKFTKDEEALIKLEKEVKQLMLEKLRKEKKAGFK
jgi:sensor histidine kinase YesM